MNEHCCNYCDEPATGATEYYSVIFCEAHREIGEKDGAKNLKEYNKRLKALMEQKAKDEK